MRLRQIIAISFYAILFTSGCTSVAERGESFQARHCSTYPSCQDKNGLQVAVEVLQDKQMIVKYFGAQLAEKGIVPLLVVAENQNADASFLLPYADPEVSILAHGQHKASNLQQQDGNSLSLESAQANAHEQARYDLGKEYLVGGGLLFSWLSFVELGPTEQAAALKQELAVKALVKKTLSPGRELSGFIYFGMPQKLAKNVHLQVKLKALNLSSRKIESFSFRVEIHRMQ
jgi:hypothetical protein